MYYDNDKEFFVVESKEDADQIIEWGEQAATSHKMPDFSSNEIFQQIFPGASYVDEVYEEMLVTWLWIINFSAAKWYKDNYPVNLLTKPQQEDFQEWVERHKNED
jgi:hypothetical protein